MQRYKLDYNIRASELTRPVLYRYLFDRQNYGPMYIESHLLLSVHCGDSRLISGK